MDNIDIDKIMHMRGIYKDNIEMLAEIYILLDEKEQARDLINKMDKEEKDKNTVWLVVQA